MTDSSRSPGMTASAITLLPRVRSVFSAECFLSVSIEPESMYRSMPG